MSMRLQRLWPVLVTLAGFAGCATPTPSEAPPPAPVAAPAPPPAPVAAPAVSVIDSHAWTASMEALAQRLLGAAQTGKVEVRRTDDNRLLVRATGDSSFVSGRAAVTEGFRQTLDLVAAALLEAPEARVLILGHTDARGSDALNNRLSKERAEAARDYLVGRGVPVERLLAEGRGKTEPVADNATAQGRALNRRVELLISVPAP
ncbi:MULTISPECIES: OmpA family protein [Caldimonas]|uniref:OmpA family protein n=1 Tax=Caldimonas TaxID=196013 RepID=UPI0003696BEE|nr:OmpA family protein [Caldimonas manganoxidans]